MTIVSPDEEKIYQTREKKFRDEIDEKTFSSVPLGLE
jgi:hypothetical protein